MQPATLSPGPLTDRLSGWTADTLKGNHRSGAFFTLTTCCTFQLLFDTGEQNKRPSVKLT